MMVVCRCGMGDDDDCVFVLSECPWWRLMWLQLVRTVQTTWVSQQQSVAQVHVQVCRYCWKKEDKSTDKSAEWPPPLWFVRACPPAAAMTLTSHRSEYTTQSYARKITANYRHVEPRNLLWSDTISNSIYDINPTANDWVCAGLYPLADWSLAAGAGSPRRDKLGTPLHWRVAHNPCLCSSNCAGYVWSIRRRVPVTYTHTHTHTYTHIDI